MRDIQDGSLLGAANNHEDGPRPSVAAGFKGLTSAKSRPQCQDDDAMIIWGMARLKRTTAICTIY